MKPQKIVHQTWKSADIPPEYQPYVDSVRQHNPDYEYRLWTDLDNHRLIQNHFSWFLPTYEAYTHHIERVDAARYFILLKYGGVYIDLDMECLKPVDSLFDQGDIWFSVEAGPSIEQKVLSNAFMAAAKNHAFFAELTRALPALRQRDITFKDVFKNTGPDMLHQFVKQRLKEHAFRIIPLNQICPRGVLQQLPGFKDLKLDQIRVQKKVTLIHHNTESWNIQLECPTTGIDGYTLFQNQDIPGHDIGYVDVGQHGFEELVETCNTREDAIGFNFNGYLKGIGGQPCKIDSTAWLKPDRIAWVCIKNQHLEQG